MFCWFLADSVYSMPLSIGTPKILQNGPKNIIKLNVKIKIAFTNFIQEHTNFFCSWQLREVQVSTPDFFRERLPS